MSDYLDRMDSLFGIGERAVYSEEELAKYDTVKIPHYYELRWCGDTIDITERGETLVYINRENHKRYHMLSEGLEQFNTFRFDYFMVMETPDKERFKKLLINRLLNQRTDAYYSWKETAAKIDNQIKEIEGIK